MNVWVGIFVVFALLHIAFSVVDYVLTAKSLYIIAHRRGYDNPWLAWVPIANVWLLGSISDRYKLRKYGYDPELRRTLLILSVVGSGGSVLINSFNLYNNTIRYGSLEMVPILLLLMVALAVLGITIAQTVYKMKAYYDLYASCRPQLAVLFLVLSIVTPAGSFLLYACRDSDEGMPVKPQE